MDIKIRTKLRAYTKGIIPDTSKFLTDAPEDGNIYGRQDGQWLNITESTMPISIELEENSGLNLSYADHIYTLGIRKEDINQNQLPSTLADDTVYYVRDLTPNYYVSGGTAYSSGNNEYVLISEFIDSLSGGQAGLNTTLILEGTNSEGLLNE